MPKDKTGREIKVGSYIAYGHTLGRSAAIRFGKVLALREKKRYAYDSGVSITVIGTEDETWRGGERGGPGLCSRVGTLLFPDRVVVLDKSRMPEVYRKLLDSFEWSPK